MAEAGSVWNRGYAKMMEMLSELKYGENFRFNFKHIKGDLVGGLTSAIVALPLALGFGILAYNGDPQGAVAGLYGAIFTGILASLFGGTSHQITGPTGGMTVILTSVYIRYGGPEALLAACVIAGLFQIAYGILKIGKYVSLVPYPVTVGFTNGIAVLIFTQQFKTFNTAPVVAFITMAAIFVVPKINKNLPKSLLGLLVGSLVAYWFSSSELLRYIFNVGTASLSVADGIKVIGSIPSHFQAPRLPNVTWDVWRHALPAGFTISLLGAIESLLASTVADNATGTRHHSNKELIGQGIANFTAPFFGGIAGTGAIVRTMVNIRSGAMTRISGIVHGLVLIVVMVLFNDLAAKIPLAALAGVLMMTAVGMVEVEPFKMIHKIPRADATVFIATMLITVVTDLITAVEVGMVMAAFLFVHRMSELGMGKEILQGATGIKLGDDTLKKLRKNKIVVYDLEGPLFFGAAKSFVDTIEKNFDVKTVILDMENVPVMDTTGAIAIETIVERLHRDHKRLLIVGMRSAVRKILYDLGITRTIGIGNFLNTLDEAVAYALATMQEEKDPAFLGKYITEPLIMLDVSASTTDELFQKMVTQAYKAGIVRNKLEFLAGIVEREALMPTVIGKGVAVPHARMGGANDQVVVMFARLKEPLVYDEQSSEKVNLVFMVSTGNNDKKYLNALRLIATNIRNESVYQRLLTSTDVHEVHHTLAELKDLK